MMCQARSWWLMTCCSSCRSSLRVRASGGLIGTHFQGRAQSGCSRECAWRICQPHCGRIVWSQNGAVLHSRGCLCLVCAAARPELAKRDFFISGESYAVGGTFNDWQQLFLAFAALTERSLACPALQSHPSTRSLLPQCSCSVAPCTCVSVPHAGPLLSCSRPPCVQGLRAG